MVIEMKSNQEKNGRFKIKASQEWPLWVIMAGMIIAGVLLYPDLPDKVPSHWNVQGQIDAYQTRFWGAFFAPLMTLGIYLLMIIVPAIDPRRENYARFSGAYNFLRWALVLFFGCIYAATILVALGYAINMALLVKAMVAILLLIIGNFMGQFRHNYFVGIKTPWTLDNEEVWQRTHRMGSKLWVAGGLICLLLSPVNASWAAVVFFTTIMIMAIAPIVYSYLIFAKIKSTS
jgi:uncharacterized membrane protein